MAHFLPIVPLVLADGIVGNSDCCGFRRPAAVRAEAVANLALSAEAVDSAVDALSPGELGRKRAQLERAQAFVQFLRVLDATGRYVDFYAAVLSEDEIKVLAANVRGKHFELTVGDGAEGPTLALMSGNGAPRIDSTLTRTDRAHPGELVSRATYWYACWQAFAAAFAWALGWGLLCFPLGGAALVCSVGASVMFPINWNDACY